MCALDPKDEVNNKWCQVSCLSLSKLINFDHTTKAMNNILMLSHGRAWLCLFVRNVHTPLKLIKEFLVNNPNANNPNATLTLKIDQGHHNW